MTDFAELHLKAALRERYALPDIGYPVPIARLMELLTDDHHLDLAELLFWLQQHSGAAARSPGAGPPRSPPNSASTTSTLTQRARDTWSRISQDFKPTRKGRSTRQSAAMHYWQSLSLGDALTAHLELERIRESFVAHYPPADRPAGARRGRWPRSI